MTCTERNTEIGGIRCPFPALPHVIHLALEHSRCRAYRRGKRTGDRLVVRSVWIRRVVQVVHLHAVTNIDRFDPTESVGMLGDRLELPPPVAQMCSLPGVVSTPGSCLASQEQKWHPR